MTDLDAMPTLHQGQYADLKIDTGTMRVWRSRMRISDGESFPVQIERLVNGRWEDVTPDRMDDTYLDGEWSGYRVQTINRRLAEARR